MIGRGVGAGNTALEEIALNLKLMLGMDLGVNYSKTYELCKLVEDLSRVRLQSTKPLVGDRVFTSESGIAVSRLLKLKEKGLPLVPYADSLLPEFVGRAREILIGKKSGRASIELRLQQLGLPVPSAEKQQQILEAVKAYSIEHKSAVPDDVLKSITARVASSGK